MPVALAFPVVQLLTWLADKTPEPKDVKAGWTAFVVFLLLIGAVVVLAFSFVKQLRKTEAARKAGVFGPVDADTQDDPSEPRQGS